MVKTIKGNLLKCDADIICHQTNFYGMMGGGVAAAIWQEVLDQQDKTEYCSICNGLKESLLGTVQVLTHHGKPFVANLFSQRGEPDKFGSLTDYRQFRRCLHEVKKFAKAHGYTVAMPGFIGCGIAGGDWDEVYKIIMEMFADSSVNVSIVFLPGSTIPGEYTVECWKLKTDDVLREYGVRSNFWTGFSSVDDATAFILNYIEANKDGVDLFHVKDYKGNQIKTIHRATGKEKVVLQ